MSAVTPLWPRPPWLQRLQILHPHRRRLDVRGHGLLRQRAQQHLRALLGRRGVQPLMAVVSPPMRTACYFTAASHHPIFRATIIDAAIRTSFLALVVVVPWS